MKLAFLCIAFLAGAVTAIQPSLNAQVRTILGHPLLATIANFIVGLAALIILTIATRTPIPSPGSLDHHPWWYWLGGLCGAFFVASSIYLIRDLGAALFFACVIAGQLATALIIDHFGLLGATPHPLSLQRLVGAVLLFAGVAFIKL